MTVHRASNIYHVINVKQFSASGNGVTDDYAAINGAITNIGSAEKVLYFPAGTYYIGTNVTTGTNITVKFDRGAIITDNGDAGRTFTINGQVDAGPHQIFDLSGAGSGVTFTNGGEGWLNWWCDGGTGTSTDPWTSSLDNTNGLQSAHDSGLTVISGTAGYYASTAETNWTNNRLTLQGQGFGATNFIINGAMTYWLDVDADWQTFRDFTLYGSIAHAVNLRHRENVVTAGINFESFDLSTMEKVRFEGILGSAVRFHRAIRSMFSDMEITYCGDTNKPAWHFDTGDSIDNHVVQGAYFDGLGFEVNYNDVVWKSESSSGDGEGSISNTYDGFRFENATYAMADVTVNSGSITKEAITIDGTISATVTAFTSDVYGDVLQIDSASSYAFAAGSTIVGASFTATIDRVDHQKSGFIHLNDRGRHRFANMHFNRPGNLASGYAVDIEYTYYCTWTNVRQGGAHDGDGAFRFLTSAYTTLSNFVGIGTVGGLDSKRFLTIDSCPNMTVNGLFTRYWGGVLITGATSDESTYQGMTCLAAADVPAAGIIEVANSGASRVTFDNCHVDEANTTGDAFRVVGGAQKLSNCRVTNSTAAYAFNFGGLGTTISDCHVVTLTGAGFYTVYDNIRMSGCIVDGCTLTAVEAGAGADSFSIQNCRLTNYAQSGAGYYGLYINGANRAFGCQVIGNWFDAEGNSPTNDFYLTAGFVNAQIIGNNFENASANAAFVGAGSNKQVYGNVGALENKPVVTPDSASTSDTGEDDLITYTIPRYHHDVFERIRVRAAGTKTGLNGNKTLKLHFGSQSVTFHPAANDEVNWQLEAEIAMKNDADHRCQWVGRHASVTHGYDAFTDDLNAASRILKITGECADAGDSITQTMFIVEFI